MGSTVDAEKIATRNRKNKLRLNSLGGTSHSHANIGILDSITEAVLTNSHTHSNKAVLDTVTSAVVTNSHTHSNKVILDNIPDGFTGSITVITAVNFTTQTVTTKTINISHGVITSIV